MSLPLSSVGKNSEPGENPWDATTYTIVLNNKPELTSDDEWQAEDSESAYVLCMKDDSGYMPMDERQVEETWSAAYMTPPVTSNEGSGHTPGDRQVEESVWHPTFFHSEPAAWPAVADTTVAMSVSPDDQEAQQVCAVIPSAPINVIVFGEAGIGKSSIINMLLGEPVAPVSNQAAGCTFSSDKFRAIIANREVMLYDTAGLNGAEAGTISPEQAIQNLRSLVRELNTVNLLVHCIRGTRLQKIVADNYHIFRNIICGGDSKVPVVLLITGLENEDDMDNWWADNKEYFDQYKLEFCGYACITSTRGRAFKDESGYIYQDLYDASKKKVVNLLADHTFGNSITIAPPSEPPTGVLDSPDDSDVVMLLSKLLQEVGNRCLGVLRR